MLLTSKWPNLQVQVDLTFEDGLLLHRLVRGSIAMEQTADFITAVYIVAMVSPTFETVYAGTSITMVLDNAPRISKPMPTF